MSDDPASSGQAVTRRGFLRRTGVAGAAAVGTASVRGVAEPAWATDATRSEPKPTTPQETLDLLLAGNRRWVAGKLRHPHQSIARRKAVAEHQDPVAFVVGCIDSRVPPEVVFDRGVGDMFVVRTGAQTIDNEVVLGSIEFGVHLYEHTRLLFVLGHERCGAVIAAIDAIQSGKTPPGHLGKVVDALRPAYRVARSQQGDLVDNMVRAQTRLTVARLKRDPLIKHLVRHDHLMVVGGRYDLDSGKVAVIA